MENDGIRDICSITGYSKDKVQAALQGSEHEIEPTQKHYDVLQLNEFHTFVGYKKNKVWLINVRKTEFRLSTFFRTLPIFV